MKKYLHDDRLFASQQLSFDVCFHILIFLFYFKYFDLIKFNLLNELNKNKFYNFKLM